MPEQITVCPCIKKPLVAFFGPLPQGKGYGTVRIAAADLADNLYHPVIIKIRVFPSLKDKCPEAQLIALPAAGEDLVPCEPVAVKLAVIPPDPAIETVVFAIVGKLDESPDVYIMAIDLFPQSHRFFPDPA